MRRSATHAGPSSPCRALFQKGRVLITPVADEAVLLKTIRRSGSRRRRTIVTPASESKRSPCLLRPIRTAPALPATAAAPALPGVPAVALRPPAPAGLAAAGSGARRARHGAANQRPLRPRRRQWTCPPLADPDAPEAPPSSPALPLRAAAAAVAPRLWAPRRRSACRVRRGAGRTQARREWVPPGRYRH